jgi:glutamine synthetase
LYIPSVFIGYNGEALDEKTVLLRSTEAVSNASVNLLRLLGETAAKRVFVTLGTEQEYFLIDRATYARRPDLKITGRTLLGCVPPKHQQLEDHYFGRIPSRVLAAMSETELELWKLGVPIKTRHNEVAPAQFEMAPIFEEASLAVDHNLMTMDVLQRVAHRHGLKAILHEKPFKGVNGSGKHCNWSFTTDTGRNLLDPTANPENNPEFLIFLVAILNAVYKHGGLLRAGIASASNEHRLGANEAPPGIISAFLGEHLSNVLDSIEQGKPVAEHYKPHFQSVKVGGTVLDVKVSSLPEIARDLTDRNRTSPFAFTGNKFEFRAVGSKQSPSFPVTLLNAAVSASLQEVAAALKAQMGTKTVASNEDVIEVVKKYIVSTRNIRFEGNGYSAEWVKEAEKRGLPNIRSAPDAFKQLLEPINQEMLVKTAEIFTNDELKSRYHVLIEKYVKDMVIEAKTLSMLVNEHILPAVFEYRAVLAKSAAALDSLKLDAPEKESLAFLSKVIGQAKTKLASLNKLVEEIETNENHEEAAHHATKVVPLMNEVRDEIDLLESQVGHKYWPFPKYMELLF